ncbi:hypothetical protein Rin_00000980 [Candidatus Regiella insecticola 5.15]|uniref:DUF29 domain-containing protein n=1 Tax=Candidatus Regiella insecticola 5.15 TaxID=1005043 RepID=G2GWG2_9ENTR|nr:DUF29 domain-containing protein [Candidatus Regiella insecticola]EGY29921.1 hypothetical protein Rin_00000980 [Candidatus Regiella insecticola 5.15]
MTIHYDSDFYGWSQEQANLLRAGNFNELDTENLLEEIEAMGRSEQRGLESHLKVLFQHLLKWKYQPARRGTSWLLSIKEQRKLTQKRLRSNPSLKSKLPEIINDAYEVSILSTARETGIEESVFPKECPWSFEEVISDKFFPE